MSQSIAERQEWLSRCRRMVIKVGSAVVTDARGLNRIIIHRLSDQIAELRQRNLEVVIVSSGAIASGVRKIGLAPGPYTISQKQAAAAVGQSVLMQAWEEAFDKFEQLVAQILLTVSPFVPSREDSAQSFASMLEDPVECHAFASLLREESVR